MNYVKKYFYNPTYRLARNFAGVYFCGLPIFCVLRELIFAILDRVVFFRFLTRGDARAYHELLQGQRYANESLAHS